MEGIPLLPLLAVVFDEQQQCLLLLPAVCSPEKKTPRHKGVRQSASIELESVEETGGLSHINTDKDTYTMAQHSWLGVAGVRKCVCERARKSLQSIAQHVHAELLCPTITTPWVSVDMWIGGREVMAAGQACLPIHLHVVSERKSSVFLPPRANGPSAAMK